MLFDGKLVREELLKKLQNDEIVKAIINRTNKYIATYDSKRSNIDSEAEQR